MPKTNWMIYGANGYTGRLIVEEAQRRGLKPVLAGRSRTSIDMLATETGLQGRVFDLREEHLVLPGAEALRVAECKILDVLRVVADALQIDDDRNQRQTGSDVCRAASTSHLETLD